MQWNPRPKSMSCFLLKIFVAIPAMATDDIEFTTDDRIHTKNLQRWLLC